MSLADFHTTVDSMLGEAGALDAQIPIAVRMAARKLERAFNFRYMRVELQVAYPASDPPSQIDLAIGVKSIISAETRETGGWEGISKVALVDSPHVDLTSQELEDKFPIYKKSERYVIPLMETTSAMDIHFLLYRFSAWPTSGFGAFNSYLIDYAEDLLLAETMLHLAPVGRDADLVQYYATLRTESVKTLGATGFILNQEDY